MYYKDLKTGVLYYVVLEQYRTLKKRSGRCAVEAALTEEIEKRRRNEENHDRNVQSPYGGEKMAENLG